VYAEIVGGVTNEQNRDYHSATYSAVTRVDSTNTGDVFRCKLSFFPTNNKTLSYVDPIPPTFDFTWTSSPPMNVQCEYDVAYNDNNYNNDEHEFV